MPKDVLNETEAMQEVSCSGEKAAVEESERRIHRSFSERIKALNESFARKTSYLKNIHFLLPFVLYFFYFFCFEAIYVIVARYSILNKPFWGELLHVNLFVIILISAGVYLLPKIAQLIVFPVVSLFLLVYGAAQLCVYKSNGQFFRLQDISTAGNAMDFAGSVMKKISLKIWAVFIVFLIVIILIEIFIAKKAVFLKKEQKRLRITKLSASFVILAVSFAMTYTYSIGDFSSYQKYIYDNFTDPNTVFTYSDYYQYIFQDLKAMFTVNFNAEKNSSKIDEFFEEKPVAADNEMTGIFEGKNLLIIQLESFEYSLMTEEICPNLTEIMSESIVFENYYGMRFGSEPTFGNEIAVNTGLYATSQFNSENSLGGIALPNTLANVFKNEDYSVDVFHMNYGEFYNREESELMFGYPKYNSLRDLTDEDVVFEDDSVIASCDDLYEAITGGEGFMRYFISYSAHPPYMSSNVLYDIAAARHPELIPEDDSDERALYTFFATCTDDMAGALLERMDADGRLDDTVILFVADHANLNSLTETTGSDLLRIQNIPCFIYSKGIEPQTVEKVCSNVDLLPTIINMFGIETDAQYIGNDIFDTDSDGLAFLPSFDWVTNKCMYYNGKVVEKYTDEEISDDYIEQINEEVLKRYEVNNLILFTDYYADSDNG